MNQETQRQALVSAGVLATFAVIGSAILASANWLTADRIAENERLAMLRQLQEILPADSYDNALLQDTLTVTLPEAISPPGEDTLYIARRQNTPVAVIVPATAPNGYNGAIDLLIGIHADGRVAAVRVSKHRETPGLGDGIDKSRGDWIDQFDGRSLLNPEKWAVRKDGGPFDQLTGATITPRAIVNTVRDTLAWFNDNQETVLGDE